MIFPNGPGGPMAPSPLPYQQVAPFSQDQQNAMALTEGLSGPTQQALLNAQNQNNAFASGAYVGPNPYLDQYYKAASQGLTSEYENATAPNLVQQAVQSGTLGSAGNAQGFENAQGALTQGLSDLGARIYEPAYEQGMQQMQQAIGMSPALASAQYIPSQMLQGVGQEQQQQGQNILNTAYQNLYSQAMWPFQALGLFGQGLNQSVGNSGGQVTVGPNPMASGK